MNTSGGGNIFYHLLYAKCNQTEQYITIYPRDFSGQKIYILFFYVHRRIITFLFGYLSQ